MNVTAFAASNSSRSINKQIASSAANLLKEMQPEVAINLLDLNDYPLPIYSKDSEEENGIPQTARDFFQHIQNSDALIISFAEHNGSYAAVYKNLFDWCSRIQTRVYDQKKVLLLASSPGPKGGASVLEQARTSMPFFGATTMGAIHIPSFNQNFDSSTQKITNPEIIAAIQAALLPLFPKISGN